MVYVKASSRVLSWPQIAPRRLTDLSRLANIMRMERTVEDQMHAHMFKNKMKCELLAPGAQPPPLVPPSHSLVPVCFQ